MALNFEMLFHQIMVVRHIMVHCFIWSFYILHYITGYPIGELPEAVSDWQSPLHCEWWSGQGEERALVGWR